MTDRTQIHPTSPQSKQDQAIHNQPGQHQARLEESKQDRSQQNQPRQDGPKQNQSRLDPPIPAPPPIHRNERTAAPTDTREYAERLQRLSGARWKRLLSVQAPYRWNVRRLELGWTLDVGCGIGRNLAHLDGHGVGVDHNATSIATARERGLLAYTVDEFHNSQFAQAGAFDSLLAAHLIEHLEPEPARDILGGYLKFVRPGGLAVFITPQERGYASDDSHVTWSDFDQLRRLADDLGLEPVREYSFPLPRTAGRRFTHNEFVLVSRLP